jgi:hypothetical protein
MSRQFRFFLLPAEIEALISDLKAKVGLRLVAAQSPTPEPAEIATSLSPYTRLDNGESYLNVHCYLAPLFPATLSTWHRQRIGDWHIQDEGSEVIQFSGCDFNERTLSIGRFYFQTNFLNDAKDALIPHREDFLKWGDRIFRAAKRHMKYSFDLEAYVGKEAEAWRQQGGEFRQF